jgi:two-component system, NtrC family, sensor histidine kinase HydH
LKSLHHLAILIVAKNSDAFTGNSLIDTDASLRFNTCMFGIAHQSTIIAAGVNLFLTVYVLLKFRGWNRALNRYFSILSFGFALWNLGTAIDASSLVYIGAFMLPPAFYAFLLTLLRQFNHRERLYSFIISTLSLFFIVISLYLPLRYSSSETVRHILNFMVFTISAPVFIWGVYRLGNRAGSTRSRRERSRLLFILAGMIAAAVAGVTAGLTAFGFNLYSWTAVAGLLYTISITVAIMRHRLFDAGRFVSRIIVIFILSLVLWFLFAVLGHFHIDETSITFLSILVASLVLVMLYEPLKSFVEGQAFRVLSSEAGEFLDQLNSFGRDMNNYIDEQTMIREFASLLRHSDRIQSFAVYTVDSTQNHLMLHDGDDIRHQPGSTAPLPFLLVDTMKKRRGPVSRNQLSIELRAGLGKHLQEERIQLYRIMNRLRASAVFPFIFADRFFGFISIGLEDPETDLTRSEEDMLCGITRQFAAALSHMRLEKLSRAREHLVTLGRLASGLAHEIRNPLATIKAGVQYLEPEVSRQDTQEFLTIIRDEVDRLDRFVHRFLDYAKPAAGHEHMPRKPLEEIIGTFNTSLTSRSDWSHIRLEILLSPDAASLDLPEDPWSQVFGNLLTNAVSAMEIEGTVRVSAGLSDTHRMLEISIEDSGPGILEEEWSLVFEPFYSKRPGGIGLGLAIVRRIVQGMNGEITCGHSVLGGANFYIRVPLP